jgi:WD40 repeat protein
MDTDGDEFDGGVYIFDVSSTSDGACLVSSMSDHHIAVYDSNSLGLIRKFKAHNDLIAGFDVSKTTPHMVYTGSDDRYVCGWDLRTAADGAAPAIKVKLAEEVSAIALGVADSLIAVGSGTTISFFDIRSCTSAPSSSSGSSSSSSSSSKPRKLGQYSDIHTDMVTQLRFSTAHSHMLASGAEDGLISLFDTSAAAGEEAVTSIFNTECPVRRLGFFGQQDEALYCLSTVETASFWHCSSAQRVGAFPNIREQLQVDYLVDCFYDASSNALCMIAGTYSGGGKVVLVEPSSLQVCGQLTGGHTATIRCGMTMARQPASPAMRLITGGEDARLCSWVLSPEAGSVVPASASSAHTSGNAGSGSSSSRKTNHHGGSGGNGKADRRHRPY